MSGSYQGPKFTPATDGNEVHRTAIPALNIVNQLHPNWRNARFSNLGLKRKWVNVGPRPPLFPTPHHGSLVLPSLGPCPSQRSCEP